MLLRRHQYLVLPGSVSRDEAQADGSRELVFAWVAANSSSPGEQNSSLSSIAVVSIVRAASVAKTPSALFTSRRRGVAATDPIPLRATDKARARRARSRGCLVRARPRSGTRLSEGRLRRPATRWSSRSR